MPLVKQLQVYKMASYRSAYLWDDEHQPRIISGWEEILMAWDESLTMPAFVQTVIENLKAASNWDSGKDYPLSHFLKFFDYEHAAMKWFIYEVVALRWMWGESRIDYLRNLIAIVDIDSEFPFFPGAPKHMTIRQFLEEHLNADEKEYVEMPPYPVTTRQGNMTVRIDSTGRRIITTNDNPQSVQSSGIVTPQRTAEPPQPPQTPQKAPKEVTPPAAPKKEKKQKKVNSYPSIQIRFNRESGEDDVINIRPEEDSFNYRINFTDHENDFTHTMKDMTEYDVQVYLSQIFRMSQRDQDPYQNIQVNLPGRPSVMFKPDISSETRELIYDSVETVMVNWPKIA